MELAKRRLGSGSFNPPGVADAYAQHRWVLDRSRYFLGISYLDAFFEAVSGFTTTGITMLTNLDTMPRSILFWRALMQWLGGLGILAFFLVVAQGLKSTHWTSAPGRA